MTPSGELLVVGGGMEKAAVAGEQWDMLDINLFQVDLNNWTCQKIKPSGMNSGEETEGGRRVRRNSQVCVDKRPRWARTGSSR